jgi:LPXTG-motif cell wall-anchored protein
MSSTSRRRMAVPVARVLRFGAAVLVASASMTVASSGTARAAPLSQCGTHRGTIVAVDFAHWGGPIVRGCGLDQRSGYALLHAAGFITAGDDHDGDGFVCRLGDSAFHHGAQYPTAGNQACINTPSASAYWSYWIAPAGQNRWSYSQLGPLDDVPKPGEVELWTFGGTNTGGTSGSGLPSVSPDGLRANTASTSAHASTTTTTRSTTTPTTTSTTETTTTSSTTTARHTATSPHPHRSSGRSRRRRRRRAASHPASPAPADTPIIPAKPTRERASAGSPVPLIIGLCVPAALLAGAGWVAWRRRRYE